MWRRVLSVLIAGLVAGCSSAAGEARPSPPAIRAAPETTATAVPKPGARGPVVAHRHRVHGPVTAVGDSVLLDAAPALRAAVPDITIDAAVDRSALPGVDILRSLAASGRLGRSIVFALGTNGGISASLVNDILDIAAGRRVVMVTSHCPYCRWTPSENAIVRAACIATRQCFVADWDRLARSHRDWFGADGVHMPIGGDGTRALARLVFARL